MSEMEKDVPGPGRGGRGRAMLVRAGSVAASGGWGLMLGPLLVATLGLLVVAWFLPMMTITKLFFWSDRVSIAGAVVALWGEGDYFIFLVIFLFSMLFPFAKLAGGLWLWARVTPGDQRSGRLAAWIKGLSKWSMLDVFVAALVVVAIKVTIVSDVSIHSGIYVFTAAVLLSTLWLAWLERMLAAPASPAGSA